MSTHLLLKTLHITGVVLLVGNAIVTFLWKLRADATGNPVTIGYSQRMVTFTDWIFTLGGGTLIGFSGVVMSWSYSPVSAVPWLMSGIGFFAASGIVWALFLVPSQIVQAKLAREFETGGEIPDRYLRLCRVWNWAGVVSTLLSLVNLYIMVYKP
jgi:uncharacterized membrane protein